MMVDPVSILAIIGARLVFGAKPWLPARLLDTGRYIFAALLVTDKDASEPATITVANTTSA